MCKLNLLRSEGSSTSLQERSSNSQSNLYCSTSLEHDTYRFSFPYNWVQFSDQDNVFEQIARRKEMEILLSLDIFEQCFLILVL